MTKAEEKCKKTNGKKRNNKKPCSKEIKEAKRDLALKSGIK